MLDPASSVEMVKVLEEDPMVGGVGGDVQVTCEFWDICHIFSSNLSCLLSKLHLTLLFINPPVDPQQI